MNRVLVVGGTGFVGHALVSELLAHGHWVTVLTRDAQSGRRQFFPAPVRCTQWTPDHEGPWIEALSHVDTVIHVAGEPVAQRWSQQAKNRILASRVDTTRLLINVMARAQPKPRAFICVSSVGYYGPRLSSETLEEKDRPGTGFLSHVAQRYEEAARTAEHRGIRSVQVRLGTVFAEKGGTLPKLTAPFKFYVGGPLGDGRQTLSWIHRDDAVGIIRFAMEHDQIKGPINAVAPNPVTARQLARTIGQILDRPSWLPIPAMMLEIFLGDSAEVLTSGQSVKPALALASGYTFRHPDLVPTLTSLLTPRSDAVRAPVGGTH